MPDQTGFSRVCPACGRRVPRNVAACRCGAALPADTSAPATFEAEPEATSSRASTVITGGILVLALGGAVYWFVQTPPAARITSQQVGTVSPAAAPDAA